MTSREGEYKIKGDYHRELNKKWQYYPIYVEKKKFLSNFMEKISKRETVLDLGCGEGVFVEKYRTDGYNIRGLDLNYSSDFVTQGNILDIPFESESFEVILCLDVIEHLPLIQQEKALQEICRVLSPEGIVLFAIPNLAHFSSRLSFLFTGRLIRTSSVNRHQGDRPIHEYIQLLSNNGFAINSRKGIFPTLPIISILTFFFPDKVLLLHSFINKLLAYPNWSFLNMIICRKK